MSPAAMSWLCIKLADSAGHGNLDEVLEIVNMPHKQLQCILGQHALNKAAKHGQLHVVRYLCEVAGVDPSEIHLKGAVRNNHLDVIRYLCEFPAVASAIRPDVIMDAVWSGDAFEVGRFVVQLPCMRSLFAAYDNPHLGDAFYSLDLPLIEALCSFVECDVSSKAFHKCWSNCNGHLMGLFYDKFEARESDPLLAQIEAIVETEFARRWRWSPLRAAFVGSAAVAGTVKL